VKLYAVLAGEATAPDRALQVFGEDGQRTVGSTATGKHSLMGASYVIVMPHDDGELFSLHFDLQLQGAG
jgi:hypothetical protein